MNRLITAAVLVTGFTLGYCAPVKADPDYCGPYRCTRFDLQHDRRAESRKLERERDLRDSLREEQYQRERNSR